MTAVVSFFFLAFLPYLFQLSYGSFLTNFFSNACAAEPLECARKSASKVVGFSAVCVNLALQPSCNNLRVPCVFQLP
ncbi:hypothetical protein VPHD518_0070 [Vibrio phage D518]